MRSRRCKFALGQNFPEPIIKVLATSIPEAELIPIRRIDPRLPDSDDWEILLALHRHRDLWDGLVTTDSHMLKQPRELAVAARFDAATVAELEADALARFDERLRRSAERKAAKKQGGEHG